MQRVPFHRTISAPETARPVPPTHPSTGGSAAFSTGPAKYGGGAFHYDSAAHAASCFTDPANPRMQRVPFADTVKHRMYRRLILLPIPALEEARHVSPAHPITCGGAPSFVDQVARPVPPTQLSTGGSAPSSVDPAKHGR